MAMSEDFIVRLNILNDFQFSKLQTDFRSIEFNSWITKHENHISNSAIPNSKSLMKTMLGINTA